LTRFVLDASTALAWCFEDERSVGADRILDLMAVSEALVPAMWSLEVANALLAGERRKRFTESEVSHRLNLLAELNIRTDGASSPAGVNELVALARSVKLSVHDAAYLWLAMREGLPLATSDSALRQAARRVGVRLLAF
jgi:predicted nucleic acid-binding protein